MKKLLLIVLLSSFSILNARDMTLMYGYGLKVLNADHYVKYGTSHIITAGIDNYMLQLIYKPSNADKNYSIIGFNANYGFYPIPNLFTFAGIGYYSATNIYSRTYNYYTESFSGLNFNIGLMYNFKPLMLGVGYNYQTGLSANIGTQFTL